MNVQNSSVFFIRLKALREPAISSERVVIVDVRTP